MGSLNGNAHTCAQDLSALECSEFGQLRRSRVKSLGRAAYIRYFRDAFFPLSFGERIAYLTVRAFVFIRGNVAEPPEWIIVKECITWFSGVRGVWSALKICSSLLSWTDAFLLLAFGRIFGYQRSWAADHFESGQKQSWHSESQGYLALLIDPNIGGSLFIQLIWRFHELSWSTGRNVLSFPPQMPRLMYVAVCSIDESITYNPAIYRALDWIAPPACPWRGNPLPSLRRELVRHERGTPIQQQQPPIWPIGRLQTATQTKKVGETGKVRTLEFDGGWWQLLTRQRCRRETRHQNTGPCKRRKMVSTSQ